MKYKVIGWTHFDNPLIEEVEYNVATYNAIVDDIREKGYSFTGCEHQNAPMGTPVLNDGKKRTFSDRVWGAIMAEAHGTNDYVEYAFPHLFDDFEEIMPPEDLHISGAASITECDLREEYTLEVDLETLKNAESERVIYLADAKKLRYIDENDTVKLVCNGRTARYIVGMVEIEQDAKNPMMRLTFKI